jgi:hypothetical protein
VASLASDFSDFQDFGLVLGISGNEFSAKKKKLAPKSQDSPYVRYQYGAPPFAGAGRGHGDDLQGGD